MKSPTHEEISERAHRLWEKAGYRNGDADQHWFEAERQLSAAIPEHGGSPPASYPSHAHVLSEASSSHAAEERSSQQRKESRAPVVASHTGPRAATPETGKPLWKRPHSS